MTLDEYKILRKRLKKGKKYLEFKWSSDKPEDKKLCDLWFKMSDMVFQYDKENGMLPGEKNWTSNEDYLKIADD